MPLFPNFTANSIIGKPSTLSLVDTSTGSDILVVSRRVILQTVYGNFLVLAGNSNTYTTWAIANATLDLTVLDKDYAIQIVVQWLDVSNTVLYSKTINVAFTKYAENSFYHWTQLQTSAAQFSVQTFYRNKLQIKREVENANNSILYSSDINIAQSCLNRAALLISKNLN